MSSLDASFNPSVRSAAPGAVGTGVKSRFRRRDGGSAGFIRLLVGTLLSLPADVLAASVFINGLSLALPFGILQVYDRIIPHSATSTLVCLTVGIGCALVMETILRISRSHVIAWGAMKLAWKNNVDAASRVALAPAKSVDSLPVAQWLQRLQAVSAVSEFNISPAPLILIDLLFVVVFFALLVAISGWIAAIPLSIFAVFALFAIRRGRKLREITAERLIGEARVQNFMIETLSGIATIKALGTEQQILRRFERLSEQAAAATYNVVRLADDAQSFGSTVAVFTQIATATVGAILATNGIISLGVVACSTMLAGRVIQPLVRLVSAWNEIQGVLVSKEVAKPIFALPTSRFNSVPASREWSPVRLAFDDVWFHPAAGQPPILRGASLHVEPGEIIAVSGGDNIGKSSVARLAAGRLIPDSGQVLIGDWDSSITAERTRGVVALIDHQNATIRGSVLNNLSLFRPERIAAGRIAAQMLNLEEDINRLPRGYDTRLGESAIETLPVGFLQRLAIARAIAGRPGLLILDEANATFDYGSDKALAKAILALKGWITIILITNRPSFAAIADRQFTLTDGQFREIEHRNTIIQTAGMATMVTA